MAAAIVLLGGAVVGVRRWVHHARLELVPVIVPPSASPDRIVHPSNADIVARMELDIRDVVTRPDRPRLAVLTFDDGPFPVESPALLMQLESLQVPADFFLIGRDAERQPAIAQALAARGFEIGNHTMTHPEMPTLSLQGQDLEVESGRRAVADATRASIRYFRPPHGNYNSTTLEAAGSGDQIVTLWDDDPGDWRTLTPDQIVAAVESQAKAPAVILLHSGKDATIEALPRIVADFRNAGFTFVTLSELQRRVPLDVINDPIKVRV